nr:hypothetical protein [Tanacetum cinerariifolium]
PLFEEEIIPMKIDQHHDNAEFDLVESLRTYDSSLIISSKIDSLLDEFTGELTLFKSIPSGIDKTDCDPEEEIRLIERLLYDKSSPHPSKEFVSKNSNADIESFSPSPISVEDSDSFMEDKRMMEYQKGMTQLQEVKGNNCQAILHELFNPFQSHNHLPQCPAALGHPA